jgi:hypothetical protein
MGPKKKTVSSPSASDNNSAGNMERLQEEMNEKLSDLVEEVRSLATELKKTKSENESLKQKVQHQADLISELRNDMNDRESHARSWSIRAINIPVPKEQESDNNIVMKAVYEELVVPILEGAKACGDIATIPARENIIEIAHILPGKAAKKPVIVRFISRFWRSLLFKHRKTHAPREAAPAPSTANSRPARMKYPFYEDLTKATFKQLKAIQADPRVTSAWTVSGSIRFKVQDCDNIYKVATMYDSVDDIIE